MAALTLARDTMWFLAGLRDNGDSDWPRLAAPSLCAGCFVQLQTDMEIGDR
jgi:hypothetical protein